LRRRIEGLGGAYSGHLTKNVTHLIAGKIIRSDKYKVLLILNKKTKPYPIRVARSC
jgi:hypothetical protein